MKVLHYLKWGIGDTPIPYLLGYQCLEEIRTHLIDLDPDIVVILADKHIAELHAAHIKSLFDEKLSTELLVFKAGEDQKSLSCVEALASKAIALGVTRRSIILAIGGGVVGNVGGMVAALLFRGIRLVHMPTTLLSMHDSVTSIKQAVNCCGIKNILGLYYPPTAIFVDVAVLGTLPKQDLQCGMYELVKNAIIFGGDHLERLLQLIPRWQSCDPSVWIDLVELGVAAKYLVLQQDAKEVGAGIVFEYGHTIGHALEISSGGRLSHGAAVAWGMKCAASISYRLGYLSNQGLSQHNELLSSVGRLELITYPLCYEDLISRIMHDNKRGLVQQIDGYIPMILLQDIGRVIHDAGSFFVQVPCGIVREIIEEVVLNPIIR